MNETPRTMTTAETPDSPPPRILIVDDEAALMRALCNTLRDHGFETTGFTDARAALESLAPRRYDLLIADLMMPGMDGIAVLQAAQHADPDIVGIIMTGEGTIASAVEAMKSGALDYILKPFKLSVMLPVLSRALAVRDLRLANAELQRSIAERTQELEAANKELEAFAFSVSHDLRSPLTVILGTTELLLERQAEKLDSAALDMLRAVAKNAERMSQLINDLLRLSRLGRQPLAKEPIDMGALVREVLRELQQQTDARRADVRVGELPEKFGDPALLKQVFTNLLSNALKFTRGRQMPVVEVACREENGQTVFSVRDNGAGFDMGKAKELFGPFQRFHSPQQFEGTGVGLSIVHRIVQRHGGRIWAEAAPDKGATFHFTLAD